MAGEHAAEGVSDTVARGLDLARAALAAELAHRLDEQEDAEHPGMAVRQPAHARLHAEIFGQRQRRHPEVRRDREHAVDVGDAEPGVGESTMDGHRHDVDRAEVGLPVHFRLAHTRDHDACRRHDVPPVAGRKSGTWTSSPRSSKRTLTGIPMCTEAASQSTTLAITRGPSMSSIIATTYGTRAAKNGSGDWRPIVKVYTWPRPAAASHREAALAQWGQRVSGHQQSCWEAV